LARPAAASPFAKPAAIAGFSAELMDASGLGGDIIQAFFNKFAGVWYCLSILPLSRQRAALRPA
jgi:hypothetical protein